VTTSATALAAKMIIESTRPNRECRVKFGDTELCSHEQTTSRVKGETPDG
jgi:hypothetical protein